MRLASIIAALVLLAATAARSASPEDCAKIADDNRRLECFDLLFRKTPEHPKGVENSKWQVRIERSKIDDSSNVFMSVGSVEPVRGRYRGMVTPELYIACRENTTSLWIWFGGHHMSDHGSYGEVTFRMDSEAAFDHPLVESTSHDSLGLWTGQWSVPFIKHLFGHDVLLVRATPYSQSSLMMEFPVAGIEDAIAPLREACQW